MTNIQNPGDFPQTEPKPARRGIVLIENPEDIEKSGPHWRTKPVPSAFVGRVFLVGSRNFGEVEREDYLGKVGYTIDKSGSVIKGDALKFYDAGYYQIDVHGEGPVGIGGSHLPSLKVNFWIGDGDAVSCDLTQTQGARETGSSSDFTEYMTRNPNLFLPLDPDLLKELRVNFENLSNGGETI